jgi:hypothetical protein
MKDCLGIHRKVRTGRHNSATSRSEQEEMEMLVETTRLYTMPLNQQRGIQQPLPAQMKRWSTRLAALAAL